MSKPAASRKGNHNLRLKTKLVPREVEQFVEEMCRGTAKGDCARIHGEAEINLQIDNTSIKIQALVADENEEE